MRISYADLPFWVLLHHQGAYDLIDQVGLQFIQDWDMIEFERTVLGAEKPFYTPEQEALLRERLHILEIQMPLMPYRDPGTHHGFELFIVPQIDQGSRCPMFWAYLSGAFTYDKLPMDEAYFEEKYRSICLEFDVNIKYNSGKYIRRFSNGIHGETTLREESTIFPARTGRKTYTQPTKPQTQSSGKTWPLRVNRSSGASVQRANASKQES